MIAVTLRGGLGNQMFQYAAGKSLALRHRTELLLDLSFLEGGQDDVTTPRSYGLACFDLQARLVRRVRSYAPAAGARVGLRSLARRSRARFVVVHQKGLRFQPDFFTAPDWSHLVGFWQSEQYFADHADAIRRGFSFRMPAQDDLDGVLADIRAQAAVAVAVHVRRGDYAGDPSTHAFHGLLDLAYYRRAVDEVAGRAGAVKAYVFSDDPEWCHRNLTLPVATTVLSESGRDAASDLRLMAACRHHVIANSSFSWWGAWLAESPSSVVVAPRAWVADTSIDTAHVVPDRWIRL